MVQKTKKEKTNKYLVNTTSKPPAGIGVKRNDLRRAGTRSTQRRPALPRSGTAGCPANPCPPTLPILPQAAVHSPGRPWGGGGARGPNGPKWTQSAPKGIFSLLGPKMQKSAHFPLLGPKVRKGAHFRILTPKSLNSDAETIGFISICGQGAKRTPKCISWPKNAFWGPKCILGPRNAFWAPKCSPAKRVQSVTDFSAPL